MSPKIYKLFSLGYRKINIFVLGRNFSRLDPTAKPSHVVFYTDEKYAWNPPPPPSLGVGG
jgi:hypothetical protein